jgi:hypothetical protein
MFFENIDGILDDEQEKIELQNLFLGIIEKGEQIKIIFETNSQC